MASPAPLADGIGIANLPNQVRTRPMYQTLNLTCRVLRLSEAQNRRQAWCTLHHDGSRCVASFCRAESP